MKSDPVNNGSRFFRNTECEYFPCHKAPKPEHFNCLMCFCPLYLMDDCGGKNTFKSGIKICTDCTIPHAPKGYDRIMQKLKERNEAVRLQFVAVES
ncbi:cysteine-rich small domain-containing protein [uncultured Endozoicomonas sp.]|uniref:cysteine-rich small domain-containing protein n=1 Tax=uncultured Endozoicomonas sp. TaxID=432652 RepID=UPI002618C3FB|nr:cysteine-rich small domain-containing protein [uncultured Endozoicomonas sp.]